MKHTSFIRLGRDPVSVRLFASPARSHGMVIHLYANLNFSPFLMFLVMIMPLNSCAFPPYCLGITYIYVLVLLRLRHTRSEQLTWYIFDDRFTLEAHICSATPNRCQPCCNPASHTVPPCGGMWESSTRISGIVRAISLNGPALSCGRAN